MSNAATAHKSRSRAASVFVSTKIRGEHLEKLAIVYVRQSSQKQVDNNIESTQLQYRLADRAQVYGWAESRIEIIDDDLGISGRSTEGRSGFQRLMAEVALGAGTMGTRHMLRSSFGSVIGTGGLASRCSHSRKAIFGRATA